MRVMQILAGAGHGGAEKFFERLVLALGKRGLEQRVITRPYMEREALFKKAEILVSTAPFGNRFLDWKTPRIIKKISQEFKPHIILSWMSRASTRCPKGPYIHVARLGGYYDLKYYQKCDYLIGITKGIIDYCLAEGWPKEKIKYLPNFADEKKAKAIHRKVYDTPNHVPLLLSLGRLHQAKAFDILLSALTQIPKAYLWIAGEGPLEEDLKAQAKTLKLNDRVRFLGWQQDTAPLFAAADIIVFPSRYEPLGSVVLEAWTHERPIVSTLSAGPKSLIEHGKTGLLCPIDNADIMAKEINTLITDQNLYQALKRNAYQHYNNHFTEQAVCEQYFQFFEQILKTGGSKQCVV